MNHYNQALIQGFVLYLTYWNSECEEKIVCHEQSLWLWKEGGSDYVFSGDSKLGGLLVN